MHRPIAALAGIVAGAIILAATLTPHARIDRVKLHAPLVTTTLQPQPNPPDTLTAAAALRAEVERGIGEQLALVAAYADAAAEQARVTQSAAARARAVPATPSGSGPLTPQQLVDLARCESGTDLNADPTSTGGWRTGLFGIEDPAAGQMTRAEQEAYAQRIYAAHGSRAWGCPI